MSKWNGLYHNTPEGPKKCYAQTPDACRMEGSTIHGGTKEEVNEAVKAQEKANGNLLANSDLEKNTSLYLAEKYFNDLQLGLDQQGELLSKSTFDLQQNISDKNESIGVLLDLIEKQSNPETKIENYPESLEDLQEALNEEYRDRERMRLAKNLKYEQLRSEPYENVYNEIENLKKQATEKRLSLNLDDYSKSRIAKQYNQEIEDLNKIKQEKLNNIFKNPTLVSNDDRIDVYDSKIIDYDPEEKVVEVEVSGEVTDNYSLTFYGGNQDQETGEYDEWEEDHEVNIGYSGTIVYGLNDDGTIDTAHDSNISYDYPQTKTSYHDDRSESDSYKDELPDYTDFEKIKLDLNFSIKEL